MNKEHELTALVMTAKTDNSAADELILKYLPFIKSETAKLLRRAPHEGDDELSIAMYAFHEATLAFVPERGSFLTLAARVIRSRLIDYRRRESRHTRHLSLDAPDSGEDSPTLYDSLDTGYDHIGEHQVKSSTREELAHFSEALAKLGLKLSDIAESCPKQERTLESCRRALEYARENPLLLDSLVDTGKVPIAALTEGAKVERKTLERHRRYIAALMLAYTNGFEVIRGHLAEIHSPKGGNR